MATTDDYQNATLIAVRAIALALSHGHEYATLEHVLGALLEIEDIRAILTRLAVDPSELSSAMESFFRSSYLDKTSDIPIKSNDFNEFFMRIVGSEVFSKVRPLPFGAILFLLSRMPHEDSYAVTTLLRAGVTPERLHGLLMPPRMPGRVIDGDFDPNHMAEAQPQTKDESLKVLTKYAINLNDLCAQGKIDPVIGRTSEISSLTHIMARRRKNNAVLVGDPGVGKTAIAEGLALRIVANDVPPLLSKTTIFSLNIAALVGGTRFRGDFEERVTLVLSALRVHGDAILFVDEVHTIMGAGSSASGSLDFANLIKPALTNGTLRCIGSTTMEEYKKHFEKDRAMVRRFKKIIVEEPSIEDAKAILRGAQAQYEQHHGVMFTAEAIDAAVDLTHLYLPTMRLPDKAISILDDAGATQVLLGSLRTNLIGVAEIEAEIARITKLPLKTVAEGERNLLRTLEDSLRIGVVGQDAAMTALTDSVFIARAGLRAPNKPAGSYLFTGPTGVGKTEAARQLASCLGLKLLRFDMSEYMERHSISRLIGAPPGYVGFGEGDAGSGLLINSIEASPQCVLLLDEIEKAHPDILNVLLQVMDDGHLTSSTGKTVEFRNVILIMTSNAGAGGLERFPMGFGTDERKTEIDSSVVNQIFSPEFRNRLDGLIQFDPLSREHVRSIVVKFIREVQAQAADRKVVLDFDEKSLDYLSRVGYDPVMGARPLARVIQQKIKTRLAREMMVGEMQNGGIAHVSASSSGIEFVFEPSEG